jgi:RNA polymerase sigma factor (sigma-70 family)
MSLPADQTTHPRLGDLSSMRGRIGPVLTELPTRQRQVLSLRYLAGLDETDVADALGISVKAVRKSAAQGIAALRARGVIRDGTLLPD